MRKITEGGNKKKYYVLFWQSFKSQNINKNTTITGGTAKTTINVNMGDSVTIFAVFN